jgi:hypothetical protein
LAGVAAFLAGGEGGVFFWALLANANFILAFIFAFKSYTLASYFYFSAVAFGF